MATKTKKTGILPLFLPDFTAFEGPTGFSYFANGFSYIAKGFSYFAKDYCVSLKAFEFLLKPMKRNK